MRCRLILLFLVTIPWWSGCNGSGGSSLNPLASSVGGGINLPLVVTKVSPTAAAPGESITVEGQGFSLVPDLGFVFDGVKAPVTTSTDTKIVVTVPAGNPGRITFSLTSGVYSISSSFLRLAAAGKEPLILADASLVCKDVKYFDIDGKEQSGTQDCTSFKLKDCKANQIPAYSLSKASWSCLDAADVLANAGDLSKLTDTLGSIGLGGAKVVASQSAIACDSGSEGQLIYSQADKNFFYCSSLVWTSIDMKGAIGAAGDTGAQGIQGSPIAFSLLDKDSNRIGSYLGVFNPFEVGDNTSLMVRNDAGVSFSIARDGCLNGNPFSLLLGLGAPACNSFLPLTSTPPTSDHSFNVIHHYFSDLSCAPENSEFSFLDPIGLDKLAFSWGQDVYETKGLTFSTGAKSFLINENPSLCHALRSIQVPNTSGGRNTALVVDSTGGQHILYVDSNKHLSYAECASDCTVLTNWKVLEDVLDDGYTCGSQPSRRISAAIDSQDRIHVSFNDNSDQLYLACTVGDSCLSPENWGVTELGNGYDETYSGGGASSIVVTDNYIHLLLADTNDNILQYLQCNRTTTESDCFNTEEWNYTQLAQCTEPDLPSLVVDSNENLYVSYVQFSNNKLKFISCEFNEGSDFCNDNDYWNKTTVDYCNINSNPSLVLNDSRLYIAYYQSGSQRSLKMAQCIPYGASAAVPNELCADGDWTNGIIDPPIPDGSSVGRDSSLAVESSGQLDLAYYDTENDTLVFGTCLPGVFNDYCTARSGWTRTELDDLDNVGQYNSLKFDGSALHLSYYDASVDGGAVKYATCLVSRDCTKAASWIPETGWLFPNSLDAVPSDVPLQFSIPFLFQKN